MKALNTFTKPFEEPQRKVKINISPDFSLRLGSGRGVLISQKWQKESHEGFVGEK